MYENGKHTFMKKKAPTAKELRLVMQQRRFWLGVLCLFAAIVAAFVHLPFYVFAILFAGGCGLMGQKSIWEKMAAVIRGR